jgi:hypothetical protein
MFLEEMILLLHSSFGDTVLCKLNIFQVMQPLLADLQRLEDGVDGIQAGIVAYCGDNLELHDFGGFRRVFNSGSICRYCRAQHSSLQETDGWLSDLSWDRETYDAICDEIESGDSTQKFAIRERCSFNKLKG